MPRSSPRPTTGNTSVSRVCLTAFVLLMLSARGAWAAAPDGDGGRDREGRGDVPRGDDLPADVSQTPGSKPIWPIGPATVTPPAPQPTDASPAGPAPTPAAMTAQARDYFDRGLHLYAIHQYAAAIEQFQRGFAVEPRREFLFAQAQAWRLSGKCDRAIPLYQQFIESTPAAVQREAARLGLDRCAPDRLRGPAPIATLPTAPPTTAPLASSSVPAPPAPWWRDGWGDVAVASGVAALGVSWFFAIASNHARDQAQSAQTATEQEYDGLWTSAQRRRDIAIGSLVGGLVLLAAGTSRLVLVREREAATTRATTAKARAGDPAAAALTIWSEGVGLTWRSCF